MHLSASVFGLLFASILSLRAGASVAAQTLEELPPGSRISIAVIDSIRHGPLQPRAQSVVGRLVRTTADSVTISLIGTSDISIARSAVTRVFVSRGISRTRSGALMGISTGLLAAFLLNHGAEKGRYHQAQDTMLAGVGFGIGAVVGALLPNEQWRRVRK